MKVETYVPPKSSFLGMEKDMGIIVDKIMKNDRLKKLLYYNTPDCLDAGKPKLTSTQELELFNNNIKIIPKVQVDGKAHNYLIISFDNFVSNDTNPEFRDNTIEFDIICHYDEWHLKDFQLRPYKIAAELDSMFNEQHLTGIGDVKLLGAGRLPINEDMGGLCLIYYIIHGEEDKKFMPNPMDEEQFLKDFNEMMNQ